MSTADRIAFQGAVAKQLGLRNRSTFTGDVALNLNLITSSKTPPHAHTIAKNLLDLLADRMTGVVWPKKSLLYADDRQIQALTVSCRHGGDQPKIHIEARPFAAMLADLELAGIASRTAESAEVFYEREREDEWVDEFRNLVKDEERNRKALGDETYEAFRKMVRWSAQRALLGRSSVSISELGWMYGLPHGVNTAFNKEMWAELIGASPLRLHVGELPIAPGERNVFKERVSSEITDFKKRWDWIIDPLVVAIALEVVVRPNPKTPPAVLHDLDNIVRDYLIPEIVPRFGTVSDHRWTIDFAKLREVDPTRADGWGPISTPPAGTKSGVTRYEVWRLPAVEDEPGFVSVALVADVDAKGGLMRQMDEQINEWRVNLSDNRGHTWRRPRSTVR